MSNFLELHSHFVNHAAGGINIGSLRSTITLPSGTTVSWQLPFLALGDGLVLVPAVFGDGPDSVRVDFGQWTPGYCDNGLTVLLPYTTSDQALAVKAVRAFHRSPDTAWTDPHDEQQTWIAAWIAAQDVDTTTAS